MNKLGTVTALALILTGASWAANIASDNAADGTYDSGWTDGANGGTGFTAWQLDPGTTGGFFVGSSGDNAGGSGDINTSGRSWGIWNNTGLAAARRLLTGGSLSTGQVFSIDLDNGWIDTDKSIGISLQNSGSNDLFLIYFDGGNSHFSIQDQDGTFSSATPYTGDGIRVELELTAPTSYVARVSSPAGSEPAALYTGHLISQSDTALTQITCWNYEAGVGSNYDVFVNSMAVSDDSIDLPGSQFSYEIVDTGTTNCHNAASTISPPAPGGAFAGQDAQYGGNTARYMMRSGGRVVEDRITGLMWQRSPDIDNDGDIDVDDKLTWAELQTYPAALNGGNFGGYNDWRLPSIKEQYSLIDFRGTDPNLEGDDTTGLIPFIDVDYFEFAYGDTANGERVIDSQYGSSNLYVSTVDEQLLFGVNFADGRIKGYGLSHPGGDKTFLVMCCRSNSDYGYNQFVDNGDGTISDLATGLTWQQADGLVGMNWEDALAYAEGLELGGYNDWRLPNVKELHSILDYTRSPDTSSSAAIDPLFTCSVITNMNGVDDYAFYWSSTTHLGFDGNAARGCYVSFGRGLGTYDEGVTIQDVHGAGCQRSDPKDGDPADYPNSGNGPQGDVSRCFNHVRCVRSATSSEPSQDSDSDGLTDWFEYNYATNTTAMTPDGDIDGDGSSNASESGAGTSPIDSSSYLGIEEFSWAGTADSVLSWQSVLGKDYRVERSTNLTTGTFTPVAESELSGTPPMNVYTDTTVTAKAAFYRVVVD